MPAPPYVAPVEMVGQLTSQDDIKEAIQEITEHLDDYQYAREYDEINIWALNTYSREGSQLRQADIEHDPNFCSTVVDAVNDRLEISSIVADNDALTTLIEDTWEGNEMDELWGQWQRNALRDGDGYIIVWPSDFADADEQTETGDLVDFQDTLAKPKSVNITYADPRQSRMFYRDENPRVKRFFAQLWQVQFEGEKDPRTRLNLFYPDRIEKYVTVPGKRQWKATDFAPFADPDGDGDNDLERGNTDENDNPIEWPQPNPYGAIPVFHLRTWRPYGKPIARNAWALQDAISKLVEYQMVCVEFQGYPQRYAIQDALSQGTQTISEDPLAEHSFADQDYDPELESLSSTQIQSGLLSNETGSQFEASPRNVMMLKGFKEVGQFATASPDSFLQPLESYTKSISSTTQTPLHMFQGLGGGQLPSGESLRVSEAPLVKKTAKLATAFGRTGRQIFEFALMLFGYPQANVTVNWHDPSSTDMAETWELVNIRVKAGVPRAQALMMAGIPEDQATEWAANYDAQQAAAAAQAAQQDVMDTAEAVAVAKGD